MTTKERRAPHDRPPFTMTSRGEEEKLELGLGLGLDRIGDVSSWFGEEALYIERKCGAKDGRRQRRSKKDSFALTPLIFRLFLNLKFYFFF